jgi:tetratricopeptide (TPR) repeat protein
MLSVLLLCNCSNSKNTWLSRNVQATQTRYNVSFNGKESYKEGIAAIYAANVDDYSKLIPIYPISNHANTSVATSQMDRAIEKANKAIKTHSIKKKPKKNPKRTKDPKYQAFMAQEEYNTQIDEAWMLLGKAQFHKGEFLESMATFTYVVRHFAWLPNRVADARIWLARSYTEMGWYFEAENILDIANKNGVHPSLSGNFAAARADLLIRQDKRKQAIPYLEVAVDKESKKKQLQRERFILAQLYESSGDNPKAIQVYTKLIKSNPPFEMELNARVNRAQANSKNSSQAIKELNKMLKSSRYADNLDKIHVTLGEIYQRDGNMKEAAKHYLLAIEKSKSEGFDKLNATILLGDLYYDQRDYLKAQPYYEQAAMMMTPDNEDYSRVSTRSQQLSLLQQEVDIVHLQDSLQLLAGLSPQEQEAHVRTLIKKLQDEEKAQKDALEKEALRQANAGMSFDREFGDEMAMPSMRPAGAQGDWYFYNITTVSNGKKDFQNRWGARKLEDNWRRKNKMVMGTPSESEVAYTNDDEIQTEESTQEKTESQSAVNTDVQYYLKQIPVTEEQIRLSNEQIADALYNQAGIYSEELDDATMANATYDEMIRRFPNDKRIPSLYYHRYRLAKKANSEDAEQYRLDLIQKFPESEYAKILASPDYVERMTKMNAVQDSLYQASYFAYVKNDFPTVFSNYKAIKQDNPLSPLMPKFLFIKALSEGKIGNNTQLIADLDTLIVAYPQSDVAPMSKDILALIKQGNQVQAGSSHGTMLELREEQVTAETKAELKELHFEVHKTDRYIIGILAPAEVDMNKLQFNVASYNFTGFMVKNFDLEILRYNSKSNLLLISIFDNWDEAKWYQNGLLTDSYVNSVVNSQGGKLFAVSENNYDLIKKGIPLNDYLDFYDQTILKIPAKTSAMPAAPVAVLPVLKPQPAPTQAAIAPAVAQKPAASAMPAKTAQPIVETASSQPATVPPAPVQQPQQAKPAEVATPASVFKAEPLAPHAFALIVMSSNFDYEKLKAALDAYNAKNYPVMNLKVSTQDLAQGQQVITVGWMPDSNNAKSYLFRIIREQGIFQLLQGIEYRSAIISEHNLNELVKTTAVIDYLNFNRINYMK